MKKTKIIFTPKQHEENIKERVEKGPKQQRLYKGYSSNVYLNTYISMQRNIFLLSSVGIAMFGISSNFKEYKNFLKFLSISILIITIIYGYKASIDFKENIALTRKHNPDFIQVDTWKGWTVITYFYLSILAILIIIIFYRLI